MPEQKAKYQRIIDWVKENINNGTFRYGDKLMSEKELSEKFELSRQTVRHATGELVDQNILTRVKGSGTFIGKPCQEKKREVYKSVAVISTFYESYIFPQTLKGIEHVLAKNGYSMQVSFTDNHIGREARILQSILEKDNIDGLIIEPAKSALPNPNLHYYKSILQKNIPILSFNAGYPNLDIPCVRIDDRKIGKKATELLLHAGHKKIGAIFKSDDGQGALRYEGYLHAMMEAGCKTDQDQVVWIDTPMMLDFEKIENYVFERLQGCTAVLAYNDQVALRMVELALKKGLRVPEDLSVIGIDDSSLAGMSHVPLTSFPHPKEVLGRKVAENLLKMIEFPDFDGNYLFDAEPVLRDSVTFFE